MSPYNYPNQMLTTAEKFHIEPGQEVPTWFRENRWYFASTSNRHIEDKARMDKLYRIADETLMDLDYKKTINPLNSDKADFKNMPATLRNYDIIKPIIDRFMGERRKRPNKFEVIPVGAGVVNEVKDKVEQQYKALLAQKILFSLQAKGFDFQQEDPGPVVQKELENKVLLTYVEEKAKDAYTALSILNQDLRLEDMFQAGFYDYLVTGSVFDFKAIFNNNVECYSVSPLEIDVIGWDNTSRFAEDATCVVRTMKWSGASIIDHFGKYLNEDQIKKIKELEAGKFGRNFVRPVSINYFRSPDGLYQEYENGLIVVEHIVWKTLTKRGILTYQSDVGIEKMPVDDSYVLDKAKGDISIEWSWENEWMETYCCSNSVGERLADNVMFLYWGVGDVQRQTLDNTSKCKLPYNGIKRGYRRNTIASPVKTGLAYQELINILHYRFDLALSRSYDKLLMFPIGLIPTIKGWDTERWMYSIRAFSIAFFDETKEKAAQAIQGMKEIDMSLSNYMKDMWQLIQTVKQEYWDAVGFNAQRYGDINSSSGKGLTEQAIYQSNSSTYDMIAQFEGYREVTLNALVDYCKFAWIDGKKGAYYRSNSEAVCYEIDGVNFANTEFGIFVVNPAEEEQKLQFYKQTILQPLAQNGQHPDLIAEIVDTDNFSKIKELAMKARKLNEEYEMAKQQQINDSAQQVASMNLQAKQLEQQTALEIARLKAETEIEKALIMADSFNAKEGDADGDGIAESDEIIDRAYERMNQARTSYSKSAMEERKLQQQDKKMALDEKKLEVQQKIAKENKNKFD